MLFYFVWLLLFVQYSKGPFLAKYHPHPWLSARLSTVPEISFAEPAAVVSSPQCCISLRSEFLLTLNLAEMTDFLSSDHMT